MAIIATFVNLRKDDGAIPSRFSCSLEEINMKTEPEGWPADARLFRASFAGGSSSEGTARAASARVGMDRDQSSSPVLPQH